MAPKRKANEEDNVPQGQAPAKKAREQNPPSGPEQGDRASSTATDSYGYPFEAMQVNHTATQEQRRTLFARWSARYALAQLSLQPEGFRAVITHVGGQRITFNLLSPPDMVAVCDAEGRWYRRLRNNETDGPRPYSDAFYQEYLQRYNLPPWFMRGGHLAMLEDTGEARLLGVRVPAPPRLERLSRLDAWMPVTPARPLPRKEVYQIEPRRLEREYLGRKFPAVLTDVPCNTYVLPTGHIMVLSRAAVDRKESVSLVGWRKIEWATENRSSIFASYKIECAVDAPLDGANERVRIRRRLRDAHVADGGIVNPTQIPAGLGHWDWLDRSDHDVAQENNFASPEEITLARGAGALSLNFERVDTPSVVFYPDPEYFNPREQPEGPGRWAFFTSNDDDSDETFAALNLGGVHGLPNYPTASQIFRLRQQYRAQPNREDLTAQFRLIWIPGEESSEDEGGDPVLSDLEPDPTMEEAATNDPTWEAEEEEDEADENDDEQVDHGVLGPDIQPSDFDLTNGNPGGKLDQTATLSTPRYYTCRITPKSRIVTLDRARPELGKVEEHKTWAYTRKGWQQYTHHAEIDWNDKKQLAALLRWRDQLNRRSGWPKLREATREAYAEDERRWLEKRVRESIDAGVPYDLVELHRQFQAKFGGRGERTEMGIAAALLRIRKQFHTPGEQGFAGDHSADEGSDDEQSEGRGEGQSEGGEDPDGQE